MTELHYDTSRADFVVIGKDTCVWCDRVKDLLTKAGQPFAYVNLVNHPEERERLIEHGLTTVPQVYYKGDRLGGHERTLAFLLEAGFDV